LKDKEIIEKIEKIEKLGIMVENLNREDFSKFMAEEQRRWSEVARVAKIGQE
jgi:hypothetical protein